MEPVNVVQHRISVHVEHIVKHDQVVVHHVEHENIVVHDQVAVVI